MGTVGAALTARIPGSKSLTNRALLCAAGAPGRSVLRQALESDDTLAFAGGLRALGYSVAMEEEAWTVSGTGAGPRAPPPRSFAGTRELPRAFFPRWPRPVVAGSGSTAPSSSAPARWDRCSTAFGRWARR